jgi:FkbM family methyltransferase
MGQIAPLLKQTSIDLGLYKPARWIFDHSIRRTKLGARKTLASILKSFVAPGNLCFDVGANIGEYTESLLSLGANVVAVDPQPSALVELKARFANNPRVKIEPVALGSQPGIATLYIREHHGETGLYKDLGSKPVTTANITIDTLDNLMSRHGIPQYIKIDVEGHELEVIKGLNTTIPFMSVEYHLNDADLEQKHAVIARLAMNATLRFNLLPQGSTHMLWPEFVGHQDFAQLFPRAVSGNRMPDYGDIYISCFPK